jgi:hypothetical protein
MTLNQEVLSAALEGLRARRARLDEQIAEVRRALGVHGGGRPPAATALDDWEAPAAGIRPARKRRKLSLAARKRIAEAQRKRWAAIHAAKAAKGKKKAKAAA